MDGGCVGFFMLADASGVSGVMNMQVERLDGDKFRVRLRSDANRAIHVSKYLPRPQQELPSLIVGNTPEASSMGAVMSAAGLLPEHLAVDQVAMMPDVAGSGLHQPWRQPSDSALLVPAQTAFDISLQRSVSVELLLDPESLPVPPVGDGLRSAAQAVLGGAQPETVMRIALHWAFACEVYHRPWAHNRGVLAHHALSVPEPNRQFVSDAPHLLIVPQVVRLIAAEAVCSRLCAEAAARCDPARLSALERGLVEAFLPSAVTGRPPQHSEIRTALWILAYDTPLGGLGDDGPPMLMAHTFGQRSIGEPQQTLLHWRDLLGLPDDHPYGSWSPGQAPSDLRTDLQTPTGLEMSDVATAVHWMLTAMMAVQNEGNQLFTLATCMRLAGEAPDDMTGSALSFVSEHLMTTVEQFRGSLRFDSAAGTGDACDDAAERQRRIERLFVGRPFFQFDDGTVVPVGVPDAVHGTIECCQEAHNGQGETPVQRRQRIGNAFGRFFEARVRHLCHGLGDRYRVIDSDVIDEVMDREAGQDSKRADVIVGDNYGSYMVVEITKRNLRLGIRYGDQAALDSWADEHLSKYQQSEITAKHLHAITAACNAPTPRNIARMVVGDLPLRQDIALSAIFDKRASRHLPPFLCGITEFEMLVESGPAGLSVPSVACAWQHSRTDMSLGLFLSNHPATRS